jgi:hypothetical protein
MGVSRGRIYDLVKSGKLTPVARSPMLLAANDVDGRRAEALARFEDVLDTSGHPLPTPDQGRAERAEEWLREATAARDLFRTGIAKIQDAEQLLLDALLGALPDPR